MNRPPRGLEFLRCDPIVVEVERARRDQGITMSDLCYRAGIGANTLNHWLAGKSPTIATLQPVLDVLGLRLTIQPKIPAG